MLKFQFDALVKHFTPVRHKGQHRASGVSVCCGSREMAFRRHFVGPKSERLKLPKGNRRETEGKPKGNGNWGLLPPGCFPQIIGRGKQISCPRVQWHLLHWVSAVLDQWLRAACVFEPTDFGLHPEPNLDFNAYGLFGFPRRLLDRPGLVQGQQG